MADPHSRDQNEVLLIRNVANGDRNAFRELYDLYQRRLFAYLLKLIEERATVEEVFNDVMFEVWRQAGSFRGDAKVATWIFGIAHHKAMNARRRTEGQHAIVDLSEADQVKSAGPNAQELAEQSDAGKLVRPALGRLSEEHRTVIELTFYHGFSYAEIASIVNCPVNTVKTRMFHARRQLRELLSKAAARRS
jgi:RNA polymerase sigma-70 factor, ECF subfamily